MSRPKNPNFKYREAFDRIQDNVLAFYLLNLNFLDLDSKVKIDYGRFRRLFVEIISDLEDIKPIIDLATRMKGIDRCGEYLGDNAFLWPKNDCERK